MSKISVIIPVYNDQSHIGRSVESVCTQTIAPELEIIIVDDGSSDNSVEIARDVLERHSMLQQAKILLLKDNHGVAYARKAAIGAATGEYIMSCDSDDWMDSQMCELMLSKAEEEGCDLVVCDYNSVESDKIETIGSCYRENFLQQLILCRITGSLWNKLIRASILKRPDFIYPGHDFSEDYVYSLQVAIYSKRIGYVPAALYNYVRRYDSLVRRSDAAGKRKRYEDDIANFHLDIEILQTKGLISEFKEEIIAHKLKMKDSNKADLNVWKSTFPELDYQIFNSRFIPFRSKCVYWLRRIKSFL